MTSMIRYLFCLTLLAGAIGANASPTTVTVAGSMQSELGCASDWNPSCATTNLTYDSSDDVWQKNFQIIAGSYEYKAAIDGSWTENYGANAQPNGSNISLTLGATTSVKFYYDDKTHWITDSVNSLIATVAGSFQSELGCAGDWDPGCLRSWLEDPDGDGIYSFSALLPGGNYEAKVAINESWDLNYGAGGIVNGANIVFASDGSSVTLFQFCSTSNLLVINGSCNSTNIPEPETIALLGLGIGVMSAMRQRHYLKALRFFGFKRA